VAGTLALVAVSALASAIGAYAQKPVDPVVEVSAAVQQDVSPPLSQLSGFAPASPDDEKEKKEKPLRLLPGQGVGATPNDTVVQSQAGPAVATTSGLNFDGLGRGISGFTLQYAPPDTVGAVGATQYVQWVNAMFAVYNKSSGAIASGFPKFGNALWQGFGGGCETNNDGDPIVQYDKAANRWIMTQFSVSTTPYLQCVAVSQTSDATGAYNRYAFSYGNTQFNDYPKLGVWPDGYYITYNIFNNASTFAGPKVCAFDRAKMLTGAAATQQCFQLGTSYGGLLPSDLDGATAPPAGSPNYLLSLGTTSSLYLWKFHVDWTTPANTMLTGPTSIPVAAYTRACNGGNCITQPGTSQKLDSLADRLMYRLAYRNRSGTQSLVVTHSVQAGGTNKRNAYAGARWYELRIANQSASLFQQGTFAPDTTNRWMGSIAMDKVGDIALGYSVSSSSVYPGVRYTGRLPGDALGTMQAETTIVSGSGSQLPNLSRWGDYSAMTVDPVDDCTFWYTQEYMKANGTFNWNTRIASFKFPGCA
jgi:hypothetical protein